MNKPTIFVIALLPCSLLLSILCYWISVERLSQQLYENLQSSLPDKIMRASVNRLEQSGLAHYFQQKLDKDLEKIAIQSALSPVKFCRAQLLQIRGLPFTPAGPIQKYLQISWDVDTTGQQESLSLGFNCEANWPILFGLPFGLCLISFGIASIIAPPLPRPSQQVFNRLIDQGVSRKKALAISRSIPSLSQLQQRALAIFVDHNVTDLEYALHCIGKTTFTDESALAWLNVALKHYPNAPDQALHCSTHQPDLRFFTKTSHVEIHGIAIQLSTTPFIYYLWYAQLRCAEKYPGGWFINPPSNRADQHHATQLINLMRSHNGHHKAINDLEEKGLRAKTLDQNRSKLKDELISALGEELASDYLFDVERDASTARFKYRLATAPPHIQLGASD